MTRFSISMRRFLPVVLLLSLAYPAHDSLGAGKTADKAIRSIGFAIDALKYDLEVLLERHKPEWLLEPATLVDLRDKLKSLRDKISRVSDGQLGPIEKGSDELAAADEFVKRLTGLLKNERLSLGALCRAAGMDVRGGEEPKTSEAVEKKETVAAVAEADKEKETPAAEPEKEKEVPAAEPGKEEETPPAEPGEEKETAVAVAPVEKEKESPAAEPEKEKSPKVVAARKEKQALVQPKISGPAGDHYLSQPFAGQAYLSPCVDAGSGTAAERGLDGRTTRTDSQPDEGTIDLGYHY